MEGALVDALTRGNAQAQRGAQRRERAHAQRDAVRRRGVSGACVKRACGGQGPCGDSCEDAA